MFSGSMGRQIGSWEDTELIKSVWNILTSNMWIWKRRPKKPFQATRRQFKRLMNRIDWWWWWWWWWQELLYCLAFLSKMPRLPLQGGSCYTDSEPSQVIMPPIKGANCSNLTRPGRQKVAEEGKALYFQGDLGRWTYVVPDFYIQHPLRLPECQNHGSAAAKIHQDNKINKPRWSANWWICIGKQVLYNFVTPVKTSSRK